MRIPAALAGCRADRIAFDDDVQLAEDEGYRVDAELLIRSPFLLADSNGEWHELDPGTGTALAPALDLFRRTVTAVEIRGKGALHLTFDEGVQLHAGPHPQFESWRLTGIGVDPTAVGPGGEADRPS